MDAPPPTAGRASQRDAALHADVFVVAEPGRAVVLEGAARRAVARHLHVDGGPGAEAAAVHGGRGGRRGEGSVQPTRREVRRCPRWTPRPRLLDEKPFRILEVERECPDCGASPGPGAEIDALEARELARQWKTTSPLADGRGNPRAAAGTSRPASGRGTGRRGRAGRRGFGRATAVRADRPGPGADEAAGGAADDQPQDMCGPAPMGRAGPISRTLWDVASAMTS